MSSDNESLVVITSAENPAMAEAMTRARATFKYLWRELTWEYRRIIPALDFTAVKAAFRDPGDSNENVEHMWLSDIGFDGVTLSGTLQNSPNWLTSVQEGDAVTLTLEQLEDWMFVMDDHVHGGFTIQALRASMSPSERRGHDRAWGFSFPEPDSVDLIPDYRPLAEREARPGFFGRLLGKRPVAAPRDLSVEHPMSENFAPMIRDGTDPRWLTETDEQGLTSLHSFALGGSLACVQALLDKGADPNSTTRAGHTALDLAEMMGWDKVAGLLREVTRSG